MVKTTPKGITDEQVIVAVQESVSFLDVLRRLGLSISGNSHKYMKSKIQRLGLNTDHFLSSGKITALTTKLTADEVLVDNRLNGYKESVIILRRVLKEKGVEDICAQCGVGTEWQGKPLRLEIHHINGRNVDNRFENLQYLCPNCHSQF